jgi:curved DNA-binding protein CbpA
VVIFLERELTVPEAMQAFGLDTLRLSPEELKAKYRTLSMHHHPDRGGSVETMQQINAAYAVLKRSLGRDAGSYSSGSSNTNRSSSSAYGAGASSSARGAGRRPDGGGQGARSSRGRSGGSSSRSQSNSDLGGELFNLLYRYASFVEIEGDGLRVYPFTRQTSSKLYFKVKLSSDETYATFDLFVYPNHLDVRGQSTRSLELEHLPHIPLTKASVAKLINCITLLREQESVHSDPNAIYDTMVRAIKRYF